MAANDPGISNAGTNGPNGVDTSYWTYIRRFYFLSFVMSPFFSGIVAAIVWQKTSSNEALFLSLRNNLVFNFEYYLLRIPDITFGAKVIIGLRISQVFILLYCMPMVLGSNIKNHKITSLQMHKSIFGTLRVTSIALLLVIGSYVVIYILSHDSQFQSGAYHDTIGERSRSIIIVPFIAGAYGTVLLAVVLRALVGLIRVYARQNVSS